MAATDRLGIYNGALLLCGERFLSSLTEDREPRYLLDHVWDKGGVRYCLEQGQWNFAMRTSRLDYSTDIEPDFGYRRAFEKPDDWVNVANVAQDEFFRAPLLRYQDESGYIYADLDTIYARYISDDDTYGFDFATWPESFREYVEAHFAAKVIRNITSDETMVDRIVHPKTGILVIARRTAKNKDAQAEPTQFGAQGAWTRARQGYRTGRRGGPLGDGGSGGSLIG